MSIEELVVRAPLLSRVRAACTRQSYHQLQALRDDQKEQFIARHAQSQVCPGEGVGIIASQSIGQPTTQIALSSFHSAGTTAIEVLEGIPRLESILNCSFKQSTSAIRVTRDVSPSDFVYLTVPDMVSSYYIERDLSSWWYPVAERHGLYAVPTGHNECAMFRMIIDDKKMKAYKISLKMIRDKIVESLYNNDNIRVLMSPEFEHIIDVSVQRAVRSKDIDMYVYGLMKSTIFPIQICGIRGIDHAIVSGNSVRTKGSNLTSILGLSFVDAELSICDSATDALSSLGIEAARSVLVRELSKVLKGEVCFDNKHINLLADFMTSKGRIIPVNISGMAERGHSYLTRASNERTMMGVAKAACKGVAEPIQSISDSIITGSRSRVGTGIIDIVHHA